MVRRAFGVANGDVLCLHNFGIFKMLDLTPYLAHQYVAGKSLLNGTSVVLEDFSFFSGREGILLLASLW